jgi:hypothetical protein
LVTNVTLNHKQSQASFANNLRQSVPIRRIATPICRVIKNIKKKHQIDHSFQPFTSQLTKDAIAKSKNSTAVGPDGLTFLHLKYLGPKGIAYLTNLFNLSLAHADIPAVWKKAHIVPKPGKPANLSTSYRPISLLSPAVKILEGLLLPFATQSLPSTHTQHGCKPMHSTIMAPLPIVTNVAIGFNEKKPASQTVIVSLDISKAFDVVDHDLLLDKISMTTLHSNITRWMTAYHWGRTAVCLFQGATSPQFPCHLGVQQGSVLSPVLFNFFVSDCPELAHLHLSYADNFHLSETGPDVPELGRKLTQHLTQISKWAKDNKLEIAPAKSSVTVFTPSTREANCDLGVYLDGVLLPVDRKPKWLGLRSAISLLLLLILMVLSSVETKGYRL